ncbi:TetR/AcrR family transcriptional regulator [Blastococcus sp. TF02A-35]|uniref:TetR/AcrR family transcriptional regulator n=1 Tax=Blastococcus sp. TF02A-35 TaxID=2559612 RepID=UPI0014306E3A|nr:TetR/AcrR family transcriptional regulator [Blastococcus sp. TF02A_35]
MIDASSGRSARWESTHRRIFAAALRLFQEHGFDAVGVSQIAAEAGVSVPTFYAHYPSKEHVVMRMATPAQTAAVLAAQPAELPLGQRIRRAALATVGGGLGEDEEDFTARWQVIASTPALRHRAAEFERATAAMVLEHLSATTGRPIGPTDTVVAGAYLSAYTAGLLAWADCRGERPIVACVEEAFDALEDAWSTLSDPGSAAPPR